MNVSYEPALVEYMQRKGFCGIAVDQVSAVGCCADLAELYTRFVRKPEAENLKASGGWRVVEAPVGELLLARGIEADDDVTLGIKGFLGLKDITCKGISAFSLRD